MTAFHYVKNVFAVVWMRIVGAYRQIIIATESCGMYMWLSFIECIWDWISWN